MKLRKLFVRIAALSLLLLPFVPSPASAQPITDRKVTISSSAPNTVAAGTNVSYAFNFTVPSATQLRSVQIAVCDTPTGACTNSGSSSGFSAASATLGTNSGLGTGDAWSEANTQYAFRLTRTNSTGAPSGPQTITFNGVTNPSAINTNGFFLRITTYSDAGYSTPVDSGTVAAVINNQLNLTGTMPESLVFCVGTTGTDCTNISGTSVAFGDFSPTATRSATSVMAASTNAGSGYSITVNGTAMSSGGNSISALAAQAASSIGSSQFGLNLKDNATPNAGAEATGGTGAATANYGVADQFRFGTGESVAAASGPTANSTYTSTYIVNVPGSQAAGLYTSTMTYICTATF